MNDEMRQARADKVNAALSEWIQSIKSEACDSVIDSIIESEPTMQEDMGKRLLGLHFGFSKIIDGKRVSVRFDPTFSYSPV